MNISDRFDWKRITPSDGHYFFGYYDRCPWNRDQTLHLALKIPQLDRLPRRGETADIGVTDLDGNYQHLTTTRCWCHQQGAMTLWLLHRPDCFIYNDYDPDSDRLLARIWQLGKGIVGHYDMPIYALSPDGRWGVSLNFARIPRRGYSYADAVLPPNMCPDLDHDGLFLVDMHSGDISLLVSYRQMFDIHPVPYGLDDVYIWLNHAIFNCDGSRILWLFRHCHNQFQPQWQTYMYTVGIHGEELQCPLPHVYWNGAISHQIWGRTPREILIDAKWRGNNVDYVVFDESQLPLQAHLISKGFGVMGHTIFSPDGKWLLADTYPDADSTQHLALVNAQTGDLIRLGRFCHRKPAGYPVDVRNDLHPRWSRDGKIVTVDSIHDIERGIYALDVSAIVGD